MDLEEKPEGKVVGLQRSGPKFAYRPEKPISLTQAGSGQRPIVSSVVGHTRTAIARTNTSAHGRHDSLAENDI